MAAYAFARASAMSLPRAHTVRTRPPALTAAPCAFVVVPAWNTFTSPPKSASAPSMTSPVRNLPGYPPAASTTPSDGCLDQVDQIGLQAQHDRLGFRIAEAHVELDDLGCAARVDHQARVEEA